MTYFNTDTGGERQDSLTFRHRGGVEAAASGPLVEQCVSLGDIGDGRPHLLGRRRFARVLEVRVGESQAGARRRLFVTAAPGGMLSTCLVTRWIVFDELIKLLERKQQLDFLLAGMEVVLV